MSFPRYPAYKDSGVEWLGEVPAHWAVARIGAVLREVSEAGDADLPILSVSIHHGVSDREFDEDELDRKVTRSEDRSKYKRVEAGDLVYNMMRAWQGGFGTVEVAGLVSPAYVVARPISGLPSSYIERVLRTPNAVEEMRRRSRGVTDFRLRLYWEEFKTLVVPVPPVQDRLAIGTFLDRETARIDALVAEQEKLIALLQEKRQAVISHAVTKGLDPDAPMRDSGIDWLGGVPAHWQVAPTGYRYEVQLGQMLNVARARGLHLRPYLRVADVQWGEINTDDLPCMDFPPDAQLRYRLETGDLLVNEGGSYVGRTAVWRGEIPECYYQKALHRLRVRDAQSDCAEFFALLMQMATHKGVFIAYGNQTTIDHLTAEQLRRHRFGFPPLEEQRAIAIAVEHRDRAFKPLLEAAEAVVRLLKERRAALITAAVTGQIDVRELTAAA